MLGIPAPCASAFPLGLLPAATPSAAPLWFGLLTRGVKSERHIEIGYRVRLVFDVLVKPADEPFLPIDQEGLDGPLGAGVS